MKADEARTSEKSEAEVREPYVITLLRHGESVANAQDIWQGQLDFALTDEGRSQAKAVAERWRIGKVGFDLIITSPLRRAQETAEIIGSMLNVKVKADPLWMERDVGQIAGLTSAQFKEKFPQTQLSNPFDPMGINGEGDWMLFLRAGQALNKLLNRPPGQYLVVSHGGILNQALHAVVGITPHAKSAGLRFQFRNTSFSRLIYFPSQHRWTIDSLNDHCHSPESREEDPRN